MLFAAEQRDISSRGFDGMCFEINHSKQYKYYLVF